MGGVGDGKGVKMSQKFLQLKWHNFENFETLFILWNFFKLNGSISATGEFFFLEIGKNSLLEITKKNTPAKIVGVASPALPQLYCIINVVFLLTLMEAHV